MVIFDRGGEVEVTGVSDFDLVRVFECGQCFRWETDADGVYTGVAFDRATRLRRDDSSGSVFITCTAEDFEAVWRDYFDLDRNYAAIRNSLCTDAFMRKAVGFGAGIRILKQDNWEALCSFIISQCNNITRIGNIISSLCREFGDAFEFEGEVFHKFPSAERLAALDESCLSPLRCGYRASYIINAARAVSGGVPDLGMLSAGTVEQARTELKKLRGVGDKVADCVALFGLNMLDAFPLDVWMKRAVAEYFGQGFDPGIFSPYAGIAQQYIFYYIRNNKKHLHSQ